MATASQKLYRMRLSVRYGDGFVKCQSWDTEFIIQTERLVFDSVQMDAKERRRFTELNSDWRLNPCLVRYCTGGDPPEYICQRGTKGRKRPYHAERGQPVGLEFELIDEDEKIDAYYCDTDWLRETSALIFEHDPQSYGDTAGLVIKRITKDGGSSVLDISQAGIHGQMPGQAVPDAFPCGYPGFARRRWG
jgi:hypothetical protein